MSNEEGRAWERMDSGDRKGKRGRGQCLDWGSRGGREMAGTTEVGRGQVVRRRERWWRNWERGWLGARGRMEERWREGGMAVLRRRRRLGDGGVVKMNWRRGGAAATRFRAAAVAMAAAATTTTATSLWSGQGVAVVAAAAVAAAARMRVAAAATAVGLLPRPSVSSHL